MTSLKKGIVTLTLASAVLSALAFAPARAQAQVAYPVILSSDTMACDAYMQNKKGEWKFKVKAERQSERYLVWEKLIIKFIAPYFDGGPGTETGELAILTDTKPRQIVHYWQLEIKEDWKFQTEVETDQGPVRIECHL